MTSPAMEMVQVPATDPACVKLVAGVGVGPVTVQAQLAEVTQDGLRQDPE